MAKFDAAVAGLAEDGLGGDLLGGLSNNGTVSGDSGLKTVGLPPLAVRMWIQPRVSRETGEVEA